MPPVLVPKHGRRGPDSYYYCVEFKDVAKLTRPELSFHLFTSIKCHNILFHIPKVVTTIYLFWILSGDEHSVLCLLQTHTHKKSHYFMLPQCCQERSDVHSSCTWLGCGKMSALCLHYRCSSTRFHEVSRVG